MPTEHVRLSYKFVELSDGAKEVAVSAVAERLSGRFDSHDIESIGETILYKLAEVFRSPGWDTFGEGDFPGINNFGIEGWDLNRGGFVLCRGELNEVNAPGLPWGSSVTDVLLGPVRCGTNVGVVAGDDREDRAEIEAMRDAVEGALQAALSAGLEQMESLGSEENARDHIDLNDPDFNEDGSLFS